MDHKEVIISTVEEALKAAEDAATKGYALTLSTPSGAVAYMGAAYFLHLEKEVKAHYPQARITCVLDCGEASGYALAALREGVKAISVKVPSEVFEKLSSIAGQYKAKVFCHPRDSLDEAFGVARKQG